MIVGKKLFRIFGVLVSVLMISSFLIKAIYYQIEIYLRKTATIFFRMFSCLWFFKICSCLWFSFHLNYCINFSYFLLIMRRNSFDDWNTFFCFHQIYFSKYFSEVMFCDFMSFESVLFMSSNHKKFILRVTVIRLVSYFCR